ncbi:acyl-CoA-binding domain-containing protein 6-like [Octopus sinensis]|uniref:Acyl-CoA-binding domain-containing protein 6-like n=1 Tax=Octopus sinensis TaxID=2607531 RepID=A0A7E6EHT1_9MOLL|nr:acyl-CoA-binding domain-containing protein 6-like [Octopus sinensis]
MDVNKIISKIRNVDFKDVKRFIKENPETVNQRSSGGLTLLMAACEQGNKELITILTESGADLNISNNAKWTALHYAVEK